jgi:hypothetical protein
MARDTQYMFERHDQKLVVLGFRGDFQAHDTWYLFDMHDQKLIVFAFMAVFVSYCPLFGVLGDLHGP